MADFIIIILLGAVVVLWAVLVYRFRMQWWTVPLTLLVALVLFLVFFRPEDEDPHDLEQDRAPAAQTAASG